MPKPLRVIFNVLRGIILLIAVYFVIFTAADEGKGPEELEPSVLLFALLAVALTIALSPTLWTVRDAPAPQAVPAPAQQPYPAQSQPQA